MTTSRWTVGWLGPTEHRKPWIVVDQRGSWLRDKDGRVCRYRTREQAEATAEEKNDDVSRRQA